MTYTYEEVREALKLVALCSSGLLQLKDLEDDINNLPPRLRRIVLASILAVCSAKIVKTIE